MTELNQRQAKALPLAQVDWVRRLTAIHAKFSGPTLVRAWLFLKLVLRN
jgi:hypothetical protein